MTHFQFCFLGAIEGSDNEDDKEVDGERSKRKCVVFVFIAKMIWSSLLVSCSLCLAAVVLWRDKKKAKKEKKDKKKDKKSKKRKHKDKVGWLLFPHSMSLPKTYMGWLVWKRRNATEVCFFSFFSFFSSVQWLRLRLEWRREIQKKQKEIEAWVMKRRNIFFYNRVNQRVFILCVRTMIFFNLSRRKCILNLL